MAILYEGNIAESQEVLLDVFREGYTDNYTGDERFLRNYLLPAQVAVIDDRHESIAGAALMRHSRITATSTRTDKYTYGSRFQNLVGIVQFARLVDPESWAGIGVGSKESVKDAARQAGMSRSYDEALINERLFASGKADEYSVLNSGSGLLICLASSSHGPEYWQEVWDWNRN